ncbi:MAG: zinc ribbon domain-containing protein [Asgard group archaeon]|nr:zinc ribbon domain-containing protein [Asgard group archaeon]
MRNNLTYCTNCGAENKNKYQYCTECGAALYTEVKLKQDNIEKSDLSPDYKSRTVPVFGNLIRRNYIIWFLLSMAFSPFMYFYLYFNFMDLNELEKYTPNKEGPSLKTDLDKLIIELVISFLIPFYIFVIYYRKYKLLSEYLEYNQKNQKTFPISGKRRLIHTLLAFFLILISSTCIALGPSLVFLSSIYLAIFLPIGIVLMIIAIGISIYLIYCEYKWQEALNERILMINPNAQEKILF